MSAKVEMSHDELTPLEVEFGKDQWWPLLVLINDWARSVLVFREIAPGVGWLQPDKSYA